MMHMFYWLGTEIKNFLFEGYNIITTWGFVSTCLGLSALAILYEAMKISQIKLREFYKKQNEVQISTQHTDSSSLLSRVSGKSIEFFGSSNCRAYVRLLIEVSHWTLHLVLGYFLMLAVMTYNGYISIALILGSGVGYYIFGPILLELRLAEFSKHRNYRIKQLEQCNPECADAAVSDRRESVTAIVPENLESEVNINIDVDVHV